MVSGKELMEGAPNPRAYGGQLKGTKAMPYGLLVPFIKKEKWRLGLESNQQPDGREEALSTGLASKIWRGTL